MAAARSVGATCDPRAMTAPGCDGILGLNCNQMTMMCAAIAYVGDGMQCGFNAADASVTACSGGGLCVTPALSRVGTCQAPAADGAACDTAAGPLCLSPARCITAAGATSGTCQIVDATKCM